jgi:hypothetical protein
LCHVVVLGVADHDVGEFEVELFDLCAEVAHERIARPSSEEHDDVWGDSVEEESHGSGCT